MIRVNCNIELLIMIYMFMEIYLNSKCIIYAIYVNFAFSVLVFGNGGKRRGPLESHVLYDLECQ